MNLNPAVDRTRQSVWALLFIGVLLLRRIVSKWWPMLLFFLRPNESGSFYKLYLLMGLFGVVSIVSALIKFLRFHYWLDDENIYLEQGVFRKTTVIVPFNRIQSVHTEQSVVYRFLGLVKIELDTAGSKGNEVTIQAVRSDVANSIVDFISENKKEVEESARVEENASDELKQATLGATILNLSSWELVKVGLAQNHLRAILILGAFLFSRIDDAREILGVDFYDRLETYSNSPLLSDLTVIGFVALVVLLMSIAVSLITVTLRHYNFTLIESNNGLKVESGLFTRKNRAIHFKRTQLFQVNQGPVRKFFKLPNIKVYQAAAEGPSGKSAVLIPGCPVDRVDELKSRFFGGVRDDFDLDQGIDARYVLRKWLFNGLLIGLVIAAVSLFDGQLYSLSIGIGYMIYNGIKNWLDYRVFRFGFSDEMMTISSGFWIRRTKSVLLYKIQAVTLKQGIYQRKHNLVDVNLYTAGGTLIIPYVDLEVGEQIRDFVLYKIESSSNSWM